MPFMPAQPGIGDEVASGAMGKASRAKHRAAAAEPVRRNRTQQWWYLATTLIVVLGVFLIVLTKTDGGGGPAATDRPRVDFDHWHAAIGVNVCGDWLPNPPAFEVRAGSEVPAGINTHGDGLIHIRPAASDEAGAHATLGRFMRFGGWKATADSFRVWGDVAKKSGDECGGKAAKVRWSIDGKEQSGDPSKHELGDLEVIALALLPDGEKIGDPPSAAGLGAPDDVSQASAPAASGASTTAPTGATAPPTTVSAPPTATPAP